MCIQQRFQKSDLLWLLAYPLYQVIGTIRHEGSHALVALLEGAKIEQFVVWPSTVSGYFAWGYVVWSGPTDWIPLAAPYLCDLLTYLLVFFLCIRLPFKRHWVWMNVVILGLVSPLVNSSYEYLLAFIRPASDIARLLHQLPPYAIHTYFGVVLMLYVLGFLVILTLPSHVLIWRRPYHSPNRISMTMDVYSHVLPSMQQDAIDKLNRALQG